MGRRGVGPFRRDFADGPGGAPRAPWPEPGPTAVSAWTTWASGDHLPRGGAGAWVPPFSSGLPAFAARSSSPVQRQETQIVQSCMTLDDSFRDSHLSCSPDAAFEHGGLARGGSLGFPRRRRRWRAVDCLRNRVLYRAGSPSGGGRRIARIGAGPLLVGRFRRPRPPPLARPYPSNWYTRSSPGTPAIRRTTVPEPGP